MKKKILFLVIAAISVRTSFAQTFYQVEGDHFSVAKVMVSSPSPNKLIVKFPLQSSRRCQCEEYETFDLIKNENGDFVNYISTDEGMEKYIIANVFDGKIKSVVVKNSQYGCCEIIGGVYLIKPATGKVESVIAAPKKFMSFWKNFQLTMDKKDSIMNKIDFPYVLNCNYLDAELITVYNVDFDGKPKSETSNENCPYFISCPLNAANFPNNNGLFFGLYNGGYMNEKLRESFIYKYGGLDKIYFISDFLHVEEPYGVKAYFKELNGEFKFIGFENIEMAGD